VFFNQNPTRRLAGGEGKEVGSTGTMRATCRWARLGFGDGRSWAARGSSGAAAWRWLAGGRPVRQGQCGEVGDFSGPWEIDSGS
jgi:hypothetical protein